jgi:hypothetical protein
MDDEPDTPIGPHDAGHPTAGPRAAVAIPARAGLKAP